MFENFLEYLQYEKRYSLNTVISYRTDLKSFATYLQSYYNTTEISEATAIMIRSWFVFLIDHEISSRSVNRKKTALKTFFKFLQKQGVLLENPMSKVLSLKTSKKLPVIITEEKLKNLLDNFSDSEKDKFTLSRDRLILEMFYATGIRLSELVNLKESDINLYDLTLKVLGKRNKERIIPFNKHLKLIIEEYLALKNEQFHTDETMKWFFITSSGKKLYHKLVYRIVNNYLGLITTQKKKSPHVLRHSFATHMLDHGADLNTIKELLGHANLSATQIYTHNSIEKLKLMYKQSHPKA
jgi:integrase/recombinase XerC